MYRFADNSDSWTLVDTGVASTDVVALAVNGSNYHIFAGTYFTISKAGGIFRSADTVIHGGNETQTSQHST